MIKSFHRIFIFIFLALFFCGCAATKPKEPAPIPLRVGVFPHYPPMIFKQGDNIKGAEADLALLMAKTLGRQAEFIELSWNRLIPALMEGKIDIIMSGMTVTESRKARVNFTVPYLKIGLVVLMRAEDVSQFNSLTSIRESFSTIGVVQGTTGEVFVRNNFPKAANIISFERAEEAPYLLINRRIDLFVHDGPSVVWLVSKNEGNLEGFWEPLNEEYLGWAVKREDQDFVMKVNSILGNWKRDGTLKEVLTRWLPHWKDFD